MIELVDLQRGGRWLRRNHRVPLGSTPSGAVCDDVWQGGSEELFPNDAPIVVDDSSYPDHGELWSVPWQVVRTKDDAIESAVEGPATGVRICKRLSINVAELTVRYAFEH